MPRALSSTLANTQGPQKIYTLKRTNSGTTSVPGMSYGYVQQLMGMSLLARPDKTCSIGEGNGKVLQYSCLEDSMNTMKRQKDRTLKDELPRSVGALYATGDQWRNNSRKNEGMEPKQKQHPVVDGTGDRSKV